MNRKFRFWLPEENCWEIPTNLKLDADGNFIHVADKEFIVSSQVYLADNPSEIFTGDIVKAKVANRFGEEGIFIISYHVGFGTYGYLKPDYPIPVDMYKWDDFYDTLTYHDEIEVIGNIFEDLHLIRNPKNSNIWNDENTD